MFVVKHEVPKRRRFRVAVPKLLIVKKKIKRGVVELFARLQTRDINGVSLNPVTKR